MISIIIPTKNEENVLDILLTSLTKQDCAKELEIVIADNQSKDRTIEVAESFKKNFQDIVITNGGMPGPGRNRGVEASSGDLFFFIDADMYLKETNFISKATDYIRKNDLGIATTYLWPVSSKSIDKLLVGSYNVILFLAQWIRPLGAQCIVCTKEAFITCGGYPEDVVMAEDHDFILNTSRKFKYGIIPLVTHSSIRRFDKEGRFRLVWKYLQSSYHNVIHGPITRHIFEYNMGGDLQNQDIIPRVTLYCELYKLFNGYFYKNLGTGFLTSYENQKKILKTTDIFFTENLHIPTNIFQANSHGPYTFYLAWKYKKMGKKVIFYAHATAEDLGKQFRIFHLVVPVIRWYLSKLYNFSDAVACPSEYTVRLLNTKYNVPKSKTIWISNGVDAKKFSPNQEERNQFRQEQNIPPEQILVTNVAMAVKRKGLDTFVYLGKVFPDIKFVWFGKVFGVLFAPKIPPTTPNVEFRGFVTDISEAYLSSDVFLFPSYEEQQGISVLEAGSAGLPVLIRDIPVYEEWLTDGENCLKARNDEEFREKLESLISNKDLGTTIGNSLHEHILTVHSFEAVGAKLENLYLKLLKS